MKKFLLALLISFSSIIALGQNQLLIQSTDKGLYVNHTVSAKENFYSIGRQYNISPKDIAAFNGLDMANGLSVGQTIMIPLTPANFSQATNKGTPVYYVVGEKEGLYRVSLKNNKVLMANLRKWNNLINDNISEGTRLIVGYLISADAPNVETEKIDDADKQLKKETKEVAKQQEKDVKQQEKALKKQESIAASKPVTTANKQSSEAGYFKSQFELQAKTYPVSKDETVTAGIFKTASGWQDGKYYALIDNVEPGTIIKVINPVNNKAVYAKVLGQMSGIRQNQGLDLRISNAAAAVLDISDAEKFIVKVNY
ncbi:MAG: LysM peptidoglycan-binding domain-containing protein [Chitinophagaceae bacterium]|nr:LysM peptidoglycan-binding domain-containing protein [Chitinophagaceae bacterium]